MMLVLKPSWSVPAWVRCVSTTRQTGNCFQQATQQRLAAYVGCEEMVWLSQCHGNQVVLAEDALLSEADGSETCKPRVACVVRTADCLPVLLASHTTPWVAAVHAGWRGLYQDILAAAVAKAPPNVKLSAWIGPGIGRQAYAVSVEFYVHFVERHPTLTHAFLWRGEQCYCDLNAIACAQLRAVGVADIQVSGFCTYRDDALFDSYRRQGPAAGRQATAIWIE